MRPLRYILPQAASSSLALLHVLSLQKRMEGFANARVTFFCKTHVFQFGPSLIRQNQSVYVLHYAELQTTEADMHDVTLIHH